VPITGVAQLAFTWVAAHRIGFRARLHLPRWTPDLKHLLVIAGPAVLAGGVVQMVLVILERIMYGVEVQGWSSLMAAVAIFSGAQLLMLGLIGEYVGRSYMTLSGKPQTLVRSVNVHSPSES
jgi:peptidoglycan biosynthesis protein MviN/MurJ (putative lipid II flippase)